MTLRRKNGRLEPDGTNPERYGGALKAEKDDDLVTKEQLANYLGGRLVTSEGAFSSINANMAIEIETKTGIIYIPIIILEP